MPSRAAILTSLGQPGPKPFEFEPLPSRFEEPSVKIGLEGHGAIVVNAHAANHLANAIRTKVPERASRIDTCVAEAESRAGGGTAVSRRAPQPRSPGRYRAPPLSSEPM